MKRSACLLTSLSLLTGACGDSKSNSDDSNSNSNSNTMATLTAASITITASESGAESSSEASATTPTSAEGTATGTASEPTAGDSTTFDPLDCGEAVVNIPIVTPSVMLVLDKSGSMVSDPSGFWDHDNDPATPTITRWQSLFEVVDLIVNNFNGSMLLGAVLFPAKTATSAYSEAACVVNANADVPIAAMNAAAILGAIPPPDSTSDNMKGGTPTTKGIKTALKELENAPADQPKFMILVTDGAANCQEMAPDAPTLFEMYDEDVAPTLAEAFANGIPTYVVGIAISKEMSNVAKDGNPDSIVPYDKMNEVAIAGGVPRAGDDKFYATNNQEELQAALEMISMQILSCVIDLSPLPKYPDYVEVTPYGKKQVADCATEDGWHYLPQQNPDDPLQVELCGKACADFQMSGQLDIQYRCPNSG